MKVKSESEVAQLCPTLSDPMGCSLPGSSIREIFQARVLECVAIAFSVIFSFSTGTGFLLELTSLCVSPSTLLLLLLSRFSHVRLCATP